MGAWTLSAVPPVAGERGQRLWRKDKDRWETLPNPFGQGDLYVAGRYLRAGRLLATCWQGAFEYDAKTDNWVCLHDARDLIAGFDASGRRVLCAPDAVGLLYVYEGDPLSAGPVTDKALVARFAELLALMDDPSWQVRTKATREVQEMGDQAADLLKSALKRADLPAEVRDRLEPILKGLGTEEKLSQKNLFTRMHPPLTPEKGD